MNVKNQQQDKSSPNLKSSSEEQNNILIEIYDRQHYFIDRHDSMAEKMINILVIMTTIISGILSITIPKANNIWIVVIPFIIHLIFFTITLINLINTIKPLSNKAIKYKDESLLLKNDKEWNNKYD